MSPDSPIFPGRFPSRDRLAAILAGYGYRPVQESPPYADGGREFIYAYSAANPGATAIGLRTAPDGDRVLTLIVSNPVHPHEPGRPPTAADRAVDAHALAARAFLRETFGLDSVLPPVHEGRRRVDAFCVLDVWSHDRGGFHLERRDLHRTNGRKPPLMASVATVTGRSISISREIAYPDSVVLTP